MKPLLLALAFTLAILGGVSPALAHDLTIRWQVTDGRLRLQAALDSTPAAGAAVELRRPDGTLLTSGTLDATGQYRWPLPSTEPLTVTVNDGLGHRRTLALTERDLQQASRPAAPRPPSGQPAEATGDEPAGPLHGAHPDSRSRLLPLGLGLTFLLALAAACMSYGTMRRLAALERRLPPDAGRG